jgi:hypothetical protein
MTQDPLWWAALVRNGLDQLSPPELEAAVQELTHDRGAFLGLLAAASDYPRVSMAAIRRPDPHAIALLKQSLPAARAVVAPGDTCAVAVAATQFEAVLALDPFWGATELLYTAWHDQRGISSAHGQALLRMAAPSADLGPLIAAGVLWFLPDHLPGSWEPYPMALHSADAVAQSLARAARLLYWADRMSGVAVTTEPSVLVMLRQLTAPDTDGHRLELREPTLTEVLPTRAHAQHRWQAWANLVHTRSPGRRRQGAASVSEIAARARPHDGPTVPWVLSLGPAGLPDVALAFRRARAGRGLVSETGGGVPIQLRRPVAYLGRAASDFQEMA